MNNRINAHCTSLDMIHVHVNSSIFIAYLVVMMMIYYIICIHMVKDHLFAVQLKREIISSTFFQIVSFLFSFWFSLLL